MAYFLTRDDGRAPIGGGGRAMVSRPPPQISFDQPSSPSAANNPASPLSRLVQDGYAPAGQDARLAHLQQNDPNYVQKARRNSGCRLSNAPGGGSSISLAWDESLAAAPVEVPRRGRGAGLAPPSPHAVAMQGRPPESGMAGVLGGGPLTNQFAPAYVGTRATYRDSSPSAFGGVAAGAGAASREPGSMAACIGGGNPSSRGSARAASPGLRTAAHGNIGSGIAAASVNAAYDSRAAPSYALGGGGNFAAPPPLPPSAAKFVANGQAEHTSLAFGGRNDVGSSNAFACGHNQNVGNGITDRRTTRVIAPPGGRSQISFG